MTVSETSSAGTPGGSLSQATKTATQAAQAATTAAAQATAKPATAAKPAAAATKPVTTAVQQAQAATKPAVQQAATQPVTTAVQQTQAAAKPVTTTAQQQAQAATQPATTAVQQAQAAAKPVTTTAQQQAQAATKPVTTAVQQATKAVAATPAVSAAAKAVGAATASASQSAAPVTQAAAAVTHTATTTTGHVAKRLTTSAARSVKSATAPRHVKHAGDGQRSIGAAARTNRKAAVRRAGAAVTRIVVRTAPAHAHTARTAPAKVRLLRHISGGHAVVVPHRRLPVVPLPRSGPVQLRPTPTLGLAATAVAVDPGTSAPTASLAAAAPSQGGPLDGALGIVALVGAGGIALLRMRQLSGAMGLTDAGTLTALGHSAATFWAGSCYSLVGPASASTSAQIAASPLAATVVPGGAAGGRGQFGVAGVISRGAGLSGVATSSGVELPPVDAPPLPTGRSERTGLVALLLAASATLGAALGGISLRRRRPPEADAR